MFGRETYSRVVASLLGPKSGVPLAENFPEGLHFTPVTAIGATTTWLSWSRPQPASVVLKLIESGFLPLKMIPNQKAFEDLGFKFGWLARDNNLVKEATLPPGWSLVPDLRTRFANILDESGIRRAEVYYEASDNPKHRIASMMIINRHATSPA